MHPLGRAGPVQLHIDRDSKTPLYRQVADQIRGRIVEGVLPGGHRLPSERELARELGVNRTTVVNAYGALAADGLVEGRVGVGTVVLGRPETDPDLSGSAMPWAGAVRYRPRGAEAGLADRVAYWSARPGVISLADGGVEIGGSPHLNLPEVVRRVVERQGAELLEDSPVAGLTVLREELSRRLRLKGCHDAGPGQVLITSGSQQGLYLVARLLLDPGDAVLVEAPAYLGTLSVLRSMGVRTVGVPVDEQGMVVEAAEHYLAHSAVRLIYTNPNFQNPTGSTMNMERRRALLRLAQQYQTPILEDDLHGDLAFDGAAPPPIRSLDTGGHVVYLGGLSSLLGSGLRLGWVLAPPPVVNALLRLRQDMDLHPNSMVQMVAADLLRGEDYPAHLAWLRATLRGRRDALAAALSRHLPDGIRWARPEGGLYAWCSLPDGMDAGQLLERAGELGVTFAPGAMFYAQGGGENALRLAIGLRAEDEITEGARRLGRAVAECLGRPPTCRPDPCLKRAFV